MWGKLMLEKLPCLNKFKGWGIFLKRITQIITFQIKSKL